MSSFLTRTQRQKHGTCWFHASMNGFLQSIYGRTFLHKIIAKHENEISKIQINTDICPIPSPAKDNRLLLLIQQNDDPKSGFLLSESGFPGLDDFQDFYLKVNQ